MENTCTVQLTNDACTLSKHSMIRAGYFEDPFVKYFVDKDAVRSPLINRFYAIRATAIRDTVTNFQTSFQICLTEQNATETNLVQIISLGAGYDATPFRTLTQDKIINLLYVEIDLPELVIRKKNIILNNSDLIQPLGQINITDLQEGVPALRSNNYALLGWDLHNLEGLLSSLKKAGVNPYVPTLFIDECALTYLDCERSNAVLKWINSNFENSCCFIYTQILPHDGFGNVMTSHFKRIQSPLLNISNFPNIDALQTRAFACGFSDCECFSKYTFYFSYLTTADRSMLDKIQPFDEYEEFHLALQHYVLLYSYTVSLKKDRRLNDFQSRMKMTQMHNFHSKLAKIKKDYTLAHNHKSKVELEIDERYAKIFMNNHHVGRWGHTATYVPGLNKVYLIGGISSHRKYSTNSSVEYIDVEKATLVCDETKNDSMQKAVFHTACLWCDSKIIVFGGRVGFRRVFDRLYVYDAATRIWSVLNALGKGPEARWRHAASIILNGKYMLVSGGKSESNEILGDLFLLDLSTLEWTKLQIIEGRNLAQRHSHKIISGNNNDALLVGGLGVDSFPVEETAVKINIIDLKSAKISTFHKHCKLTPRFSFSTVEIPNGGAYISGGVGTHELTFTNSFSFVDRDSFEVIPMPTNLPLENQFVSSKFLFFKHCMFPMDQDKLGIYGGGGCCFSFGTHINHELVVLKPKFENSSKRILMFQFDKCLQGGNNLEELLQGRVPVKFTDAPHKNLHTLWKPEYLKEKYGSKTVSIHSTKCHQMNFVKKNFQYQYVPFAELVDGVFNGSNDDELFYLRSVGENIRKDASNIVESFPELASDFTTIEYLPDYTKNNMFSTALRISSKGMQLWTHYDIMDNILCQISGRKRIVLWPPEEIENLYVDNTCSEVTNIDNPDSLLYPRFPKNRHFECILEPGDMLYIPSLWFHNVTSLTASISINCFWRHLEREFYSDKDLYGSRDLKIAERTLTIIEKSLNDFDSLPEYYRSFYLSKVISTTENKRHTKLSSSVQKDSPVCKARPKSTNLVEEVENKARLPKQETEHVNLSFISFSRRKKEILDGIDKSPKGSFDAPILNLLKFINEIPTMVSTSSCSGRVSIFGLPRFGGQITTYDDGELNMMMGSMKGSGEWLLVSHGVVDHSELISALSKLRTGDYKQVSLRCEPFVLHVEVADMDIAQKLLQIGLQCGYRESGIVVGMKKRILVQIRTLSNRLEVPIIEGMLDEEYQPTNILKDLVELANERYVKGQVQISRFEAELRKVFSKSRGDQLEGSGCRTLSVSNQSCKYIKTILENYGLYDKSRRIKPSIDAINYLDVPVVDSNSAMEVLEPFGFRREDIKFVQAEKDSTQERQIKTTLSTLRKHLAEAFPEFYKTQTLPRHYERHGDCLLLPASTAIPGKPDAMQKCFGELARSLNIKKIGLQSIVDPESAFRRPNVEIVYPLNLSEKDCWVTHQDNGILYAFDVTKCMFSSGNITEKLRVSTWKCQDEVIGDMYCGIGYWSLILLKKCKAKKVYSIDWNPDATKALKRGLKLNGISDGRCEILEGDCTVRGKEIAGLCDRIILGLIPDSSGGWEVGVLSLNFSDRSRPKWMHVHQNVYEGEMEDFSVHLLSKIRELVPEQHWEVRLENIVRVKSYGPRNWHYVFDILFTGLVGM